MIFDVFVTSGVTFLNIVGLRDTVNFELGSSDGHSSPIYFRNGIPIGRRTETRAFVSWLCSLCANSKVLE